MKRWIVLAGILFILFSATATQAGLSDIPVAQIHVGDKVVVQSKTTATTRVYMATNSGADEDLPDVVVPIDAIEKSSRIRWELIEGSITPSSKCFTYTNMPVSVKEFPVWTVDAQSLPHGVLITSVSLRSLSQSVIDGEYKYVNSEEVIIESLKTDIDGTKTIRGLDIDNQLIPAGSTVFFKPHPTGVDTWHGCFWYIPINIVEE